VPRCAGPSQCRAASNRRPLERAEQIVTPAVTRLFS
jgi:hypothetical protein